MSMIPRPTRTFHIEPMTKRSTNMRHVLARTTYEAMNFLAFVSFLAIVAVICAMIKF